MVDSMSASRAEAVKKLEYTSFITSFVKDPSKSWSRAKNFYDAKAETILRLTGEPGFNYRKGNNFLAEIAKTIR